METALSPHAGRVVNIADSLLLPVLHGEKVAAAG